MKSREFMITTLLNSDKLLADDGLAELDRLLTGMAGRAAVSAEYSVEDAGRFKRWARRMIIRAVGWYIRPIVERQNAFNRDVLACLNLCRGMIEEAGPCE